MRHRLTSAATAGCIFRPEPEACGVPRILFVTGSDTGVGKTVLTALLIRRLRARGEEALAVKPFCSGGRADAEILRAAQDDEVTLDAINPWAFRAALTPLLAARRERRAIPAAEALHYLRAAARLTPTLLVEGAGGLLSPLGEGYAARELIARLRAEALVVCANRLGVINQARLTLAALPPAARAGARIVLMAQPQPDSSAAGNVALLRELVGPERIWTLPFLAEAHHAPLTPALARTLDGLTG
jgi:dethiobiotin synthetase